jgi:hypothetical protein
MDLSVVTTFDGTRGLVENSTEFVEELELATHIQRESYRSQFDKFRIFAFRSKLVLNKPAATWYVSLPMTSKVDWSHLETLVSRLREVQREWKLSCQISSDSLLVNRRMSIFDEHPNQPLNS